MTTFTQCLISDPIWCLLSSMHLIPSLVLLVASRRLVVEAVEPVCYVLECYVLECLGLRCFGATTAINVKWKFWTHEGKIIFSFITILLNLIPPSPLYTTPSHPIYPSCPSYYFSSCPWNTLNPIHLLLSSWRKNICKTTTNAVVLVRNTADWMILFLFLVILLHIWPIII